MKTYTLVLLLSLTIGFAYAQEESTESKYAAAKFEKHYNAGQPDSIFATFSAATKTALPLNKTQAFLGQLKSKFGDITKMTFVNYHDGFGIYKTAFQKGLITLSLAVNGDKEITGLYAKPYQGDTVRNTTAMALPFKGEWTVFWGGDTKELNYHVVAPFQKNAFDIVINNAAGKSFKTNGKTNEDYYAFGQPLTAVCDAEVVFAVDGIKDNVPGILNPTYVLGNSVMLKTKNNEYILLAHFKHHTIKVKQGDLVKRGQLLGLCGNSGNSSEPHLHFHIQDNEDFNLAMGIKCYFDKLKVNGLFKTNYSPIKGDKISTD